MYVDACIEETKKEDNHTMYMNSDSREEMKALASHSDNYKVAWNFHEVLKPLEVGNKVTLLWVPRHMGIRDNEEADRCARKGAERPSCPSLHQELLVALHTIRYERLPFGGFQANASNTWRTQIGRNILGWCFEDPRGVHRPISLV